MSGFERLKNPVHLSGERERKLTTESVKWVEPLA
ncbi:MAG: hypothetical protein UT41_C0001G0049 [Candidatus Wolfebacteria bacterium GW2011_GWC2_39_22]|uniref:Uncharacterized protein n=1 Tax=Candidatus Wolfebacteria bacterium GW2011_GWC2_39_22 TaxID=1619013 RepID=A0A0G0QQ25_9BACT|nr:MAG: hypothetical protein UT41_C0001G0049 [Candidatus Wolfebacteria bacterium GW2011_GWC2_39_22]